ncbi:MAG TPA: ATP-binding protein, partial [Rhodoferax sp.]
LRPEAEKKDLLFTVDVPNPAVTLRTDRRALSQIIINLTGNAIKFTERGSVHLRLQRLTVTGRNLLSFSVEDTGPGIAQQDQPRLFEAFSRIEAANRRKLEGSGLGLHLSRKLAEQLGGRITYHGAIGQGSTFTLEFWED